MNYQIEEDWGWFIDIEEEVTNNNNIDIYKNIKYIEYKENVNKKDVYKDFIGRQKYYVCSVCIYILSLFVS
jgi:hypothetical protein